MESKRKLIAAGHWLKAERRRTGASAGLVARMATLVAQRDGDPVRIHQQQISDIENATEDRGPRALRPWFRHVRAAFDSGLIDAALGTGTGSLPHIEAEALEPGAVYDIVDAGGLPVGRLTWFGTRPPA